jgi:N-acetylglucosamine-6-phosphate deacetylase
VGFFDLQVNGYAGVDFNGDGLDQSAVEAVCERLRSQGVEGILATIITDTLPVMEQRLKRLASLHRDSPLIRRVVKGIHIEGPFLNPEPGYRGAHPVDAIVPAGIAPMERLLEAAGGLTRLVTLAPERDSGMRVTHMLADCGIVVSAGHTNASLEELHSAVDAGLSMFTHLGNGCPASLPRHDNIIQRALSLRGRIWLCFIADGAHVPWFTLKNYLDLVGIEKTIIVTDAIVASDLGPGSYTFGRWKLKIGEDLIARSPDNSHLVGSTVTMPRSFTNIREHLGLSEAESLRTVAHNPKLAINII